MVSVNANHFYIVKIKSQIASVVGLNCFSVSGKAKIPTESGSSFKCVKASMAASLRLFLFSEIDSLLFVQFPPSCDWLMAW